MHGVHRRGRPPAGHFPLEEGVAQMIQKQSNRRHIVHASTLRQSGADRADIQSQPPKIQSPKRSRHHLTVYPRPSMQAPYARQ